MSLPYSYQLFGLTIGSEIPLPELPPETHLRDFDVTIRPATGLPDVTPIFHDDPVVRCNDRQLLLTVPEAEFFVADGTTVLVKPRPGAAEADVRVYLLGSVMGALCYQRGLYPLHANTIEMNGTAFVFCGDSGAGKSTLAARLMAEGLKVWADDICAVSFDEAGQAFALPGVPRVKLWEDALERFGYPKDPAARVNSGDEKYALPLARGRNVPRLPLGAIYLLDRETHPEPEIATAVAGAAALEIVLQQAYRPGFPAMMQKSQDHFRRASRLAGATPLFRVNRAWGVENLDTVASSLIAHLRASRAAPSTTPDGVTLG